MSKRKRNTPFDTSLKGNMQAYNFYFYRLLEMALSSFQWEGFPDSVDTRYLELILFKEGQAVYFRDDVIGDLALQVAASGRYNIYGIPNERRAFGANGYNFSGLSNNNSVIIFNNVLHSNTAEMALLYAEKLYDLDQSIIVNAKAQKTPTLITCEEKQDLTLKNAYKEFEGNAPVIYARKSLNPSESIRVMKTDAPYVADKLYLLKQQIWNEALTYLGITNTNTTKKERMIVDEVNKNMGGTFASRFSRLEPRERAAEEINRIFGLNVSVKFREYEGPTDVPGITDETTPEEGAENE